MQRKITLPSIIFCFTLLAATGLGMLLCNVQEVRAEITADASLSHLSFPLDKAARLTITVSGTSRNAAFELPEIENIRFHNQGQSSQFMLNGTKVSAQVSHNYLVQGLKAGKYTLPAIEVTAGGDSSLTQPIDFQITAAGQQINPTGGENNQAAGEMAFLRISETGSHYPGEIVPLTLKAYFTQAYRAEIDSLPTLRGDGVVMSPLSTEPQQTVESVNGKNYHVLTWQTSLSGIKAGEHHISFAMEASMLIPQRRRPRSPFGNNSLFDDPFFNGSGFDNFFGGHQRQPILSESPEVLFKVLPLPTEDQPANFTGAIGHFDLAVSASPVRVEVGEPITLTMEVSGKGNFDRVEAPVFPESPGWKSYSPTASFIPQNSGEISSGSKVFEQALVAKQGGIEAIPALSFSYFDPLEKKYITRSSSPIAIQLKGVDAAAPQTKTKTQSQTQTTQAVQPAQSQTGQVLSPPGQTQQQVAKGPAPVAPPAMVGLAPIHLETGTFHSRIVPLFLKPWWIAVCLFTLLVLFSLMFIKLRRRNIRKHPERLQQKQKKLQLERDLTQIDKAMQAGDGAKFLALSRTTIQQQLGLLWNIEAAALSLADIESRLGTDSPLVTIFKLAEEAAYGGAGLSEQQMQDTFGTMKTKLEELV